MGELIAFRARAGPRRRRADGRRAGDHRRHRPAARARPLHGPDRLGVRASRRVAGPLLGGFLVETLSWRWVFYVNLPIGFVAVLIVVFKLHLHVPTHRHAIDWLGATLLTAGVSALILVTTWGGNEYPWGSATILGLAIAGVAC